MDAGKGIDLDEIWNVVAIASDIDSRDVAQSERIPDCQCHRGHARLIDNPVLDKILVVAFDLDGIEEIIVTIFRNDLHHGDDFATNDADGEFVARKKFFDENRPVLAYSLDRRLQLCFVAAERLRGHPHR